MQKIIINFLFSIVFLLQVNAQKEAILNTISVFPYQQVKEADAALQSMDAWKKSEWKTFVSILNDTALQSKASNALSAYVNKSTKADPVSINKIASLLAATITKENSYYANELLIKYLGLLGSDAAVKSISNFLSDETLASNAARALATIHSDAAIAALNKALAKASETNRKHIQAALNNSQQILPSINSIKLIKLNIPNKAQHLLVLQNQMAAAKNPLEKKEILSEAANIPGLGSFMFVSQSLQDPILAPTAAIITTRLALADAAIYGQEVRSILEKSLVLLNGEDSVFLSKALRAHLKAMPYDNGFVSLFNGKDLNGWKALVGNPISRSKMSADELQKAEQVANEKTKNDWIVKDGLLIFTGHGDNLATTKQYSDFEMYVDWKITKKGDAGIYLRGTPQVQIWDTSRRDVGAQVGSGGLYNNQKNQSKPLVVADNKIGEWNTFHIIMQGEKVTVYLNDVLVTDHIILENYWDSKLPIFSKEQIELQAHGTYVAYRNIYLREIPTTTISTLTPQEKSEGFTTLFDGSNMNQWVGNTAGYLNESGAIVVHPELSGGNLYTKDEYADFEYRFEFQLTPGANNGIGIRAPLTGDAAYVGMEIQVLDSEADMYKKLQPYQYHGSVYGVIPAKRGFLKPIGDWNQESIIVKGTKIKVILNGETIVDGDIKDAAANGAMDHNEHPGLKRTTGHIGFLGHGDVVRFRNIRIKNL